MNDILNIHKILDTALRVPPLFIIDEILKGTSYFSPPTHIQLPESYILKVLRSKIASYSKEEVEGVFGTDIRKDALWSQHENITDPGEDLIFDESRIMISLMGKLILTMMVFFVSNVVFLLSWRHLVKFYRFFFSLVLVVCSYQTNMVIVNLVLKLTEDSTQPAILQSLLSLNITELLNCGDSAFYVMVNYVSQACIGLIFIAVLPKMFGHSLVRILILLSFLLPSFVLLLPVSTSCMHNFPVFTALLPLGVLKFILIKNLYNCFMVFMDGYDYAKMVLENYGLDSLIQTEWARLNVPNVLRTFWLLRTAHHIARLLGGYMYFKGSYISMFSMKSYDILTMFKEVMVYGCETSIALVGMTSIVSYIGHYIGILFQNILMVEDEERDMGTVCAILFFILGEQSGLTMLDENKRFARLGRNFSFLFTSILHFTHNMVNPILLSLSASRNPVTHRHIRALFVSFLLILLPTMLVYFLWSRFPFSTWLIAVTAFSVQAIVKTIVSLCTYSLFIIDAYGNKFGENLDDYTYYIQAFGKTLDFIFGILLFFTGVWIYLFEAGGSIRATMICIHAYFNIWCEAKHGWNAFMKRRTAVNKINSLPDASSEELHKHSDVCAICFQELQSAKITKCHHMFHSTCLRKWLYVQDSCPLCHETLYRVDNLNDRNLSNAPDSQLENNHDNQQESVSDQSGNDNDELSGNTGEKVINSRVSDNQQTEIRNRGSTLH